MKSKTKTVNRKTKARKSPPRISSRARMFIVAGLFATTATAFAISSFANPPEHDRKNIQAFVEDRARGLVWKGLEKNDNLCPQGYYIAQGAGAQPQTNCTHGPDPAPEGLDATVSVEPLSSDLEGTAETTAGIVCDGDGVSGPRVELIYARASDVPDRYSQFLSSFPVYAANMNKMFVESGDQTGSPRSIRFVTDSGCNVVVRNEVLSPTADDSFANMRTELQKKGYTNSQRKYSVWMDATVYCGIANIYSDSTPGSTNRNNVGPTFARTDSGCWGGSVETHEIVHTLGGVQNDAPHTSGGYHCNDNYDRMCYADGGSSSSMTTSCADYAEESHLDCNKDDYFNTSTTIPSNNYLYSHWNVANSVFLIIGRPGSTPTPTPTPSDTAVPTVAIASPKSNEVIGNKVNIRATAQDNVGVIKTELFIDNKLAKTSTTGEISFAWNTRKVSRGQHSITVKAYDAAGNSAQTSIFVVK